MEVRIRDELTDRATLQITFLPLDGAAGITASSFATTLQAALSSLLLLHTYPRSLVQVTLQSTNHPTIGTLPPNFHSTLPQPLRVYQQQSRQRQSIRPHRPHPDADLGASQRATLINAAMLGVMAAGIQAKATLCSVAIAVIPSEIARGTRRGKGQVADQFTSSYAVVADPSPLEESVASSTHVFAFAVFGTNIDAEQQRGHGEDMDVDGDDEQRAVALDASAEAKLALVQSTGEVRDWEDYKRCVGVARRAAKEIRARMRAAVEAQFQQA